VAIVEDHPLFRQGLAGLVEDTPELELVCAVRSVPHLDAELAALAPPDVVLLDLQLAGPGRQGPDAIGYLCRRGFAVLVVSATTTPSTVVAAIRAGAGGYLNKEAEPDEIVRAVHAVAGGSSYISPSLAGFLLDASRQIPLTRREVEILRLLAAGEKDLDIAEELYISVHTVHSHLDRIRAKTGHHRRVDLARYAIERGLATYEQG
jgi:DNA-binding NarL/FixJ family response regulator